MDNNLFPLISTDLQQLYFSITGIKVTVFIGFSYWIEKLNANFGHIMSVLFFHVNALLLAAPLLKESLEGYWGKPP